MSTPSFLKGVPPGVLFWGHQRTFAGLHYENNYVLIRILFYLCNHSVISNVIDIM